MSDWRMTAYEIACAKQLTGDAILGVASLHHELAWAGFTVSKEDIENWRRNLVAAGALHEPTRRGEPYRMAVEGYYGAFVLARRINMGGWDG